ncbi:hypothetical protein CR513_59898, partial [Mucuna pruriens]
MESFHNPIKTQPLTKFILVSSSICALSLCVSMLLLAKPNVGPSSPQHVSDSYPTTVDHLVFGLASTGASWPKRKDYTKLWWNFKHNQTMRGCVFVDTLPHENANTDASLPPLCVSEDTSRFPYTYKGGLRSAIRVARVVKETVALNHSGVRWYVFGDDDTIFFPHNLVKTLSKYDHRLWYYVGSNSEIYEGTQVFGFGMAFGGGGFAISSSLAQVLAKVLDSCIQRYSHLYGSDARVYSCITELGVGLTHEPGFHQVDLRGNIFGLLAAHPLTPLLSLHHPDYIDPIFPNMTTIESLQHLFEAVNVDSERILRQTVCYEKRLSWTISMSWGYAVQVFQNNILLPEVLRVQKTFMQWLEGDVLRGIYTFNIREVDPDPCKRPTIFYLDKVSSGKDGIISSYKKYFQNCSFEAPMKELEVIKVVTNKLYLDNTQTPRRHCCDVLPSNADTSHFLYTYKPGGLRSAIRVARVVKETVALNHSGVRWYVFGDDDTIFFPHNLVKTLSKYDHRLWYYVGSNSEIYEASQVFGFGMAFGGGGFAISSSLAQILAKVFDSCIQRYSHLYGSDARVYSCITELGVGLTHEPGFHQVDLRGNIFGLLAAHPLTPLLSLHHPDHTDPIFPNMTTTKSLQHLFEAQPRGIQNIEEEGIPPLNKPLHKITTTQSLIINLLLVSFSLCAIYTLAPVLLLSTSSNLENVHFSLQTVHESTTLDHLVFGIASSGSSWPKRKEYVKLWWNSVVNTTMKGCVFVDSINQDQDKDKDNGTLPPLCVSEDISRFRYTYPGRGGMRSAIRVARVVKETVALNHSRVRWYVFGDDDTLFFPRNLVKTLSKYDHGLWYYIGANSESYKQNWFFGFGMGFGGAGFAISSSLARVLAKVFDSCIERYPHLYGSDARVYSCMTELGVGLTHEPGFHQVDLRGNGFGLLTAHPVTPLLSLHHPDYTDPIFPYMTTIKALQHLFEAANVDSQRLLQQTVCYEKRLSRTISVSWGYAAQVYQNHMSLPDVLKVEKTFKHWTGGNVLADLFTFNTRELHPDPCKRPTIFYLENLSHAKHGIIISSYRKSFQNCSSNVAPDVIRVATSKLELDIKQLLSQRRHCCDVLPSSVPGLMEIAIRECAEDELIHMQ